MFYSLSVLTGDHSTIYLAGIGLLILGLLSMYLGVKDESEKVRNPKEKPETRESDE